MSFHFNLLTIELSWVLQIVNSIINEELFSSSYDLNGDGNINILDVVSTVNIVLGMADWVDAADYNGDNVINVLDIVSIVNVILGS